MSRTWTNEQENILLRSRQQGKTYKAIAHLLPYKVGALKIKARRLGLVDKRVIFPDGIRRCSKCRKVGDDTNFYTIDRICKGCARIEGRRRGKKRLAFLNWLKTSVGCTDCKEHFYENPECLDYDHVGETKEFEIAANKFISLAKLQKELMKTEVVCSNCHRKRTQKRKHWMKQTIHVFKESEE